MVANTILPPQVATGSAEQKLHYLYSRKHVLDELIRTLEAYSSETAQIPRKGADRLISDIGARIAVS